MKKKPTPPLRGIVSVLNTPFTEDDRIDLPGLARNVRRAVEAGVAGFLVPALASEVGKLSPAERESLVATTLEAAAGRVPVIGGASAASQTERLAAAKRLIGLGCAGILVALAYEGPAGEASLRQVEELAGLDPGFIMLQDWDPSGYGLPLPFIVRLFERVPAFTCLKVEVVPAGPKYSQVLEATGGRLHVSGGWAVGQMIEGLDRGVHAFMPTGMHEIYVAIYRLYAAGRRDEAQRLFRRLLPVLAFSNQHLDISIHFFKRLLWKEGYFATPRSRAPIMAFDARLERSAEELIDYAMALTREML